MSFCTSGSSLLVMGLLQKHLVSNFVSLPSEKFMENEPVKPRDAHRSHDSSRSGHLEYSDNFWSKEILLSSYAGSVPLSHGVQTIYHSQPTHVWLLVYFFRLMSSALCPLSHHAQPTHRWPLAYFLDALPQSWPSFPIADPPSFQHSSFWCVHLVLELNLCRPLDGKNRQYYI